MQVSLSLMVEMDFVRTVFLFLAQTLNWLIGTVGAPVPTLPVNFRQK